MEEYNAAIKRLEGEINKAFDSFRGRVSVGCSEFLKVLDVTPINSLIFGTYHGEEWRFRHNPTFMIKATAFMKLKGIKFQHGLIRHLLDNRKDAENLGCNFSSKGKPLLPARRTFNYFMNERLTKEIWGLIDFIVEYSKETASRRGILLNFATVERPKRELSDRTLFRRKREKTHEVCKLMRKSIYPKIKLDLARNTVFRKGDFLDMLTHVALTHDFTENGSCTYAYQKGERTPSADALLYHLKKYRHREALEDVYAGVFDMVLEMARKSGFLQRPLDLAIDTTDILYYGDKCDYMVVGTKPQKGTNYCFKFATVNAVLNGERFVLYAIPVGHSRSPGEIVERLMEGIKGKVKVNRVYLDRGFYSLGVIEYFNRNGIKFLMPAVKSWRIKGMMEKHKAPYVTDYRMTNQFTNAAGWFRLVLVKGESGRSNPNETYAFATNMETSANTAFLLLRHYDRRWGIETAFRVKEAFRARTTSKNYIIRLFYFMFSVTLYNLWILLNTLLSLVLFGKLPERPLITAKMFGTMLYMMEVKTT
jgi:putative transposase